MLARPVTGTGFLHTMVNPQQNIRQRPRQLGAGTLGNRVEILKTDCNCSAEDGGFEPPRAFTQHAFQACAIGH